MFVISKVRSSSKYYTYLFHRRRIFHSRLSKSLSMSTVFYIDDSECLRMPANGRSMSVSRVPLLEAYKIDNIF